MASHPTQPKPSLLRMRIGNGNSLALRHQLMVVLYATTFGSVWLWAISGATMLRFAREMGMPDYGFGVLTALPFVGTLLQLPTSYLIEKYGQRKLAYLLLASIGRSMWTVTALIPWVLPGCRSWWWPIMALSLLLTWSFSQAWVPVWMNWMSDVIPRPIRGRFFGLRSIISQPIGVLVTFGIGYALDWATQSLPSQPDIMLKVTSAILGISGLFGVLEVLCFIPVDDRPRKAGRQTDGLFHMMLRPLKQKEFRRYIAFNFTLTLAIACIGQYIWPYLFDVVGWSNWWANIMLIGAPLCVRVFGFWIWGRLIDQLGKKPVILIAGCVSMADSVGWLLVGPNRFILGYSLVMLAVIVWPGMEIANFNFMLNMSGGGRGKDRTGGMAHVAVNSIATAVGGILSGLIGALVAKTLGGWSTDLPVMNIHLTYHGVLLMGSGCLKLTAVLLALGLHEPQAVGTRDAIRYMSASLYSNVRQAFLMPTRVVGRIARWSYKITPLPRKR